MKVKLRISILLFLLALVQVKVNAQKVKSELLQCNTRFYPENPLSKQSVKFRINVTQNFGLKKNMFNESQIEKIIKENMTFDSITLVNLDPDFIVEFSLSDAIPMKVLENFKVTLTYYSTYRVLDKRGLEVKSRTILTQVRPKGVREDINVPDEDDIYPKNISRQFSLLCKALRTDYDYHYDVDFLSLYYLKDDKTSYIKEINDTILNLYTNKDVSIVTEADRRIFERAIAYNKNAIATLDTTNDDLKKWRSRAYVNLLNYSILLKDEASMDKYYAEILKFGIGGLKAMSISESYLKNSENKKKYEAKVAAIQADPNSNLIKETTKVVHSSTEPPATVIVKKSYNNGFIIRKNAKIDTMCVMLVDYESAPKNKELIFVENNENATKQRYKSEEIAYYYVDGFLYKSIPPPKPKKQAISFSTGNVDKWTSRNELVLTVYESDSLFFGVIVKDAIKVMLLINKSTGNYEECEMENQNFKVSDFSIRRFFKKSFDKDDRLSVYLKKVDFKKKDIAELIPVIEKCEEYYGNGNETFKRNINRIANSNLKTKCN